MKALNQKLSIWVMVAVTLISGTAHASVLKLTPEQMPYVMVIARAINVVNSRVPEARCLEYAMAIYRASAKYEIDPAILVAIAQQESGFRESLPEGAAGEIGIVQIRKMWLNQETFKEEFGTQTVADLKKPEKSFLFAAWLLRDLRASGNRGSSLPFWSYYNSVKFENRFKYFLAVNRNIAAMKKNKQTITAAWITEGNDPLNIPGRTAPAKANNAVYQGDAPMARIQPAPILRQPATAEVPVESGRKGRRWIPDALMKLRRQAEMANAAAVAASEETTTKPTIVAVSKPIAQATPQVKRPTTNSLIRAAALLNIQDSSLIKALMAD